MFRRGALMEQVKKEQNIQKERQKELSELARVQQENDREHQAMNTLLKLKQGILNDVDKNTKINLELVNENKNLDEEIQTKKVIIENFDKILEDEKNKQEDIKKTTLNLEMLKNDTLENLQELKTTLEKDILDNIHLQGKESEKLRILQGDIILKTNESNAIQQYIVSQNARIVELDDIIKEKSNLVSLKDNEKDVLAEEINSLVEMKKIINNY